MGGRARAYTTMLGGALGGGGAGAAFDQVTVTLSPAYFLVGKGVGGDGGDLRAAAAWMGFRGGLALGAVVVGAGVWREARGVPVAWRRYLVTASAASLAAAVGGALGLWAVDPFDVRRWSSATLTPAEADRYLACWGAHIGAYLGAVVTAIACGARGLRRRGHT